MKSTTGNNLVKDNRHSSVAGTSPFRYCNSISNYCPLETGIEEQVLVAYWTCRYLNQDIEGLSSLGLPSLLGPVLNHVGKKLSKVFTETLATVVCSLEYRRSAIIM